MQCFICAMHLCIGAMQCNGVRAGFVQIAEAEAQAKGAKVGATRKDCLNNLHQDGSGGFPKNSEETVKKSVWLWQ
jgi:hypothetical protein